ncbi:MAG: MOSC domain-containing protein [Chloroflexi bacterium]|nr:MOSC domain-containing protein [Chloroflexota bacterium]MBI3340948.1 MOSC domain-containing protein [Chloroflexota bacterium]
MIQRSDKHSTTLSSLVYYPIKACRGFSVDTARVERMGLEHDRRMMVVTPGGKFLTQREFPKLALVTPTLEDDKLMLSAPAMDTLSIAIAKTGQAIPVEIWKSRDVQAIDQGKAVASWFSDWLGASARLVHIADGFQRKVSAVYAVTDNDQTGFADGYPILLASEESLADLNSRLETQIPMNRFRPNVVVKGCEPFDEDQWKRIRIGDVELAIVKPCARCVVTTIDKETLEKSKEPLKTLAAYRKQAKGVMFGQNAIPLNEGRLEIGMNVKIL